VILAPPAALPATVFPLASVLGLALAALAAVLVLALAAVLVLALAAVLGLALAAFLGLALAFLLVPVLVFLLALLTLLLFVLFGLARLLHHLVDRALHEERALGEVVVLALENLLEAPDCLPDRDVDTRLTRELLGHVEGLREEPLQPASPV